MKVLSKWAPLPLRLIIGYGFVYHGCPKVFTTSGHASFQGMLVQIGVPLPAVMSWVVALVEFLGGLAILAGAFLSLAAVLLTCNMLVAMFTVHLQNGFNFLNITGMTDSGPQFGMPGYEVNLLYIAGLLSLLFMGVGPLSIDGILHLRKKQRQPDKQTVITAELPDRVPR